MNYNDQILDNKPFNFFKQLMYNIALSICIMLVGVLILVWGFKFRLYEVLSDSQAPYFVKGDMVIVKEQKDYKVGDIIKFNNNGLPVTHRLIAILTEGGKDYYICHGDNVQNADGSYTDESGWHDDRDFVNGLWNEGKTLAQIQSVCGATIQVMTSDKIEGEVIAHIDNYGTYFKFIQDHWGLLVALVAGIWCISSTVQNEIDMKKCGRLM